MPRLPGSRKPSGRPRVKKKVEEDLPFSEYPDAPPPPDLDEAAAPETAPAAVDFVEPQPKAPVFDIEQAEPEPAADTNGRREGGEPAQPEFREASPEPPRQTQPPAGERRDSERRDDERPREQNRENRREDSRRDDNRKNQGGGPGAPRESNRERQPQGRQGQQQHQQQRPPQEPPRTINIAQLQAMSMAT